MKHKVDIRGVLIPNSYKWYYDFFGEESTCPKDVSNILDAVRQGDEIEVYINSPGGVIDVGSEIYTLLREKGESVKIFVTGEACSAASIVAMAAYCEMSPTALMMVHCVSSAASGNHNDMRKMEEILSTADRALCSAYVAKSGMTEEDALAMMEHETWLTAAQAQERGLIDGIMFSEKSEKMLLTDGPLFKLPDEKQMEKIQRMMRQEGQREGIPENTGADTARMQFNLLKLKGEKSR